MPATTEHQSQHPAALPGWRCEVGGRPGGDPGPTAPGRKVGGGVYADGPPPIDPSCEATDHIETFRAAIRRGIGQAMAAGYYRVHIDAETEPAGGTRCSPIGTGRRVVYLETLGRKWATVWNPNTLRRVKIERAVWDAIAACGRKIRRPRHTRRTVRRFITSTGVELSPSVKRRIRTMLATP